MVLFDEIEKAHSDVFNMLLQILDDGHLTDSQGRKVNFRNTVIIMTSNVGARLITEKQANLGFSVNNSRESDKEKLKETVMAELKKVFKPEFLNRVDDTIVFNKLTPDDIKLIAKNMLKDVKARAKNLNIGVNFDENAIEAISDAGFDPVYGARPLRRAIQSKVEDKLSEEILKGEIKSGENVLCSYDKEQKQFFFHQYALENTD